MSLRIQTRHGHIRGRHSVLGLPTTRASCCTLHGHRERESTLTGFTSIQEVHLATVIEILQSIRQSDMSPILSRVYSAPGGTEALDVLMKYMYVLTSTSLTALYDVCRPLILRFAIVRPRTDRALD